MSGTANVRTEHIRLDDIIVSEETQARFAICEHVVGAYKLAIQEGDEMPPVDVFSDGSQTWMADGFHRWYASKEAGLGTILARVHPGSLRDAILFSCGANHAHGLQRSNKDKRRAVETLLRDAEWGKMSSRWIAEQCHVSNMLVGELRVKLKDLSVCNPETEQPTVEKRLCRDGKYRQVSIGAQPETVDPVESPPKKKISGGITFNPEEFGDGTLDLEELQAPYDECLNWLTQIIRILNAEAASRKRGVYLADKINRIKFSIDEIRAPIDEARPEKICPYCSGIGCDKCRFSGWWSKAVARAMREAGKRD